MSTTMRFNITLPKEIGVKLKASKNRSRLIAESLRETFDREEQRRLELLLEEGYKATAKEDLELNKEFEHTIGDGLE
jgi:hypothetical protein